MKKIFRVSVLILMILSVVSYNSCKKDEVPVLTTSAITNITGTTASGGGTITSEGTGTVISRGICWSTGTAPTIADNKTSDGAGAGSFTSNIIGLNGASVYYVRAYATNGTGTGYGMAMSFTTLGQVPAPTSSAATNITTTSATLNGSVNANYLSTVVTFEYGTTTSYGSTVGATPSPLTGNTNTNVSGDITGLTAGTTYHLRIKAVNSLGTTYGNDITFTTLGQIPTATTLVATNITTVAAQLNGTVNANYLSSVVTFEYGLTTGYGSIATATQSPVTGSISTTINSSITGLTAGTTYHFRIKAVNSLGITYGSDLPFTTLGQLPTATTLAATNINTTISTLNGTVTANYLSTVVTFEYGLTTGYGSIATATQSPVSGNSITNVSASITGLALNTTYHYRVKAVNGLGTTNGNDVSFTTTSGGQTGTVTDIDGNVYNTVTIGTQVWMASNLKTTKYNDGTAISNVTVNGTWAALTTGAYCDYANTAANSTTYGRLYNWYVAASTNPKKVCPTGWHVPSDAEWTTLTTYLGGESVAGGKLKETGTTHWSSPNTGATNETGFTALPGGGRDYYGTFSLMGIYGYWWSSTEYDASTAWYRNLFYDYSGVYRGYTNKIGGLSVRCLRD